MKISRLEYMTLLLTAAFLAFAAGWFLRGGAEVGTVRVDAGAAEEISLAPIETADSERAAWEARVNLNTAGSDELQTLPGIGPAKAARILAYRAAHGRFGRISDLLEVDGMDEETVDGLRPYARVE